MGRLPGTTIYRNVQQYPEAYTYNGIVIVRIDAPIYFANTSYIKDRWIYAFYMKLVSCIKANLALQLICTISFPNLRNKYRTIWWSFVRLREFEFEVDKSTKRGPEVERVYFVIIELARKFFFVLRFPSTFNILNSNWNQYFPHINFFFCKRCDTSIAILFCFLLPTSFLKK